MSELNSIKVNTIDGESVLVGTLLGKATVADILHANSEAPLTPLVRIDCAVSSDQGFRDGLLGQDGAGGAWVQQAKGGTLYLHGSAASRMRRCGRC